MQTARKLNETPILETERLFLRKFRMEDAADVFAYCSDPETARYVTWDAHRTEADSRRFLEWVLNRYQAGEAGDWAIMDRQNGRIIGSIGIVNIETAHRCCEIGYVIGRPYWGHGYTAEALERLVRFLFEECGMNRIQAKCCQENHGSARVLEKAGFQYEGLLRERMFMKNRFWDLMVYSLLDREWRAVHAPAAQTLDRVLIEEALPEDLPAILDLQKRAYLSEAEIYGYSIAPLTQTLEDIRSSFRELSFLKAIHNGQLVGSIRARIGEGTCFIGRLVVEPEFQHQGIGRKLLATMEALHPGMRFELFTGHLSQRNIELYEKMGYRPFKTVRIGDRESLVYLEKKP